MADDDTPVFVETDAQTIERGGGAITDQYSKTDEILSFVNVYQENCLSCIEEGDETKGTLFSQTLITSL